MITVKATWVVAGSPEASSAQIDRFLAFQVVIDTHSGDLGRYNWTKLSVLRNEKGIEVAPVAWQSESEGAHHQEGILKFPKGAEQDSRYLELAIKDFGGIRERVLRWEMGRSS